MTISDKFQTKRLRMYTRVIPNYSQDMVMRFHDISLYFFISKPSAMLIKKTFIAVASLFSLLVNQNKNSRLVSKTKFYRFLKFFDVTNSLCLIFGSIKT